MTIYLKDLCTYFKTPEISLTELKGGLSLAKNYLLQVREKKYVLRVLSGQSLAELNVAIAAAKKGISPHIFWVADDKKACLMEYIDANRFSLSLAKKHIHAVAHAFQQIHTLKIEGISQRASFRVFSTALFSFLGGVLSM